MIVVDTSVWIDFFRDRSTPAVATLVAAVEQGDDVAITDVIFTEILQGVRSDRQLRTVERRLDAFDVLRLETLDDFRRAAMIYRTARRRGLTIRRTSDCLIASVCIREAIPLLHTDADFDRLASCTKLVVVQ